MRDLIRHQSLWNIAVLRIVSILLGAIMTTVAVVGPASAKSDAAGETITLGGGCFWCLEAVFTELKGVTKVESGYAGGHVPNPGYAEVSSGTTGHAEVVEITFDPRILPREVLLAVFFAIHDPTTLNRQGNDVGTQYRSIAFYRNAEQKAAIERAIATTAASGEWNGRIVTEVV